MFSIFKLLQSAGMWGRRRNGPKTAKRHTVAVEQLDHRRLLSVNFTGNVPIDFPATEQPGVVVFNSSNTPGIQHPIIPPNLQPLIPVSGFDLSEIRVSYDAVTDRLSIGLNQPRANPSNPASGSVIAGDVAHEFAGEPHAASSFTGASRIAIAIEKSLFASGSPSNSFF